jgi:phosphoribosylformimino-5-aminoimidazole carboxamide ribotide isomerase
VLTRYHGETTGASEDFELLPAIDLRAGRVVRLRQGDFARETVYSDDPVAVARSFADAGATWIHIVDLDGARAGEPVQATTVTRIVAAAGERTRCQVAGGLRTAASVAGAFEAGAARVVVGTAALRDPAFAGTLVRDHGGSRIVVALDVRDGMAVGDGWRDGADGIDPAIALGRLADLGVQTFAATAIDRDGLLGGPDLDLLARLVELGRGRVIASGGVATIDDILAARAVGCGGAIVGRALYEGQLDLGAAIRRLEVLTGPVTDP